MWGHDGSKLLEETDIHLERLRHQLDWDLIQFDKKVQDVNRHTYIYSHYHLNPGGPLKGNAEQLYTCMHCIQLNSRIYPVYTHA